MFILLKNEKENLKSDCKFDSQSLKFTIPESFENKIEKYTRFAEGLLQHLLKNIESHSTKSDDSVAQECLETEKSFYDIYDKLIDSFKEYLKMYLETEKTLDKDQQWFPLNKTDIEEIKPLIDWTKLNQIDSGCFFGSLAEKLEIEDFNQIIRLLINSLFVSGEYEDFENEFTDTECDDKSLFLQIFENEFTDTECVDKSLFLQIHFQKYFNLQKQIEDALENNLTKKDVESLILEIRQFVKDCCNKVNDLEKSVGRIIINKITIFYYILERFIKNSEFENMKNAIDDLRDIIPYYKDQCYNPALDTDNDDNLNAHIIIINLIELVTLTNEYLAKVLDNELNELSISTRKLSGTFTDKNSETDKSVLDIKRRNFSLIHKLNILINSFNIQTDCENEKNIYEKLNDICNKLLTLCENSNKEQAISIQEKIFANLLALFDIIDVNSGQLDGEKLNLIKDYAHQAINIFEEVCKKLQSLDIEQGEETLFSIKGKLLSFSGLSPKKPKNTNGFSDMGNSDINNDGSCNRTLFET